MSIKAERIGAECILGSNNIYEFLKHRRCKILIRKKTEKWKAEGRKPLKEISVKIKSQI
jgi:hypothetical protein